MSELIAVFRMSELDIDTRIRVIEKLGRALNFEHGSNWTDEIVNELVEILYNSNEIVKEPVKRGKYERK